MNTIEKEWQTFAKIAKVNPKYKQSIKLAFINGAVAAMNLMFEPSDETPLVRARRLRNELNNLTRLLMD